MNRRKFIRSSAGALFIFLFSRGTSWANKAEAKIEAPDSAAKGTEMTIRVTVIHSANNFLHYVEWLWIKVNENEVARWDFTASNKPEGATFTREIKYKVEEDVQIKAKASCNLHGSAGETAIRVMAQE